MKTWGWILLVLGSLSFIGKLTAGSSPVGPLFWIGLGAYLIHRANQKAKEQEEKDHWDKR